ncbi:MAG: sigma-70 family RNA polymerase sigma factor [Caulobacteraceae bacterium]
MDAIRTDFHARPPAVSFAAGRLRAFGMSARDGASTGPNFSGMIVAIAERGDREAFAALFGHFAPRVKSYLMRLGARPEAAEELAQEALLTVWRRAVAFDPTRAAASTWIFTIARNLRIDLARREKRPPPSEDLSMGNAPAPAPDVVLAAGEDESRIGAAIATLSVEQAQVVRLAFFSDKPHSEIAAELGLPLGTVKSRLRLAMSRLRLLLGDIR